MIDVKACPGFVTPLGRVGENNSRRIVFDVSPGFRIFPALTSFCITSA